MGRRKIKRKIKSAIESIIFIIVLAIVFFGTFCFTSLAIATIEAIL